MLRAVPLFLCLIVGAITAWADEAPLVTQLQPGTLLRGHFTQERSLQGFQAPLKSEGSFVVAPGRGLIWKVEKPFATITVITPSGLVQSAQGSETLRLPAARIPFIARFYDMLSGTMTGDLSSLKQQFDVVTSGSSSNWSLQLTPKVSPADTTADPQNMPVQRLDISGDQYVRSVDIHRLNGDRDVLKFVDQHLDTQSLSADEQALLAGAGNQ